MLNTASDAFEIYLNIPERFPPLSERAVTPISISSMDEISAQFDVFLFDAYGVLNCGSQAIEGAGDSIEKLQAANKQVFVVTNSATPNPLQLREKFQNLGFNFLDQNIVSSRSVLESHLQQLPAQATLGVINTPEQGLDCQQPCHYVGDEKFWQSDCFIFLSSQCWSWELQGQLEAELRKRPRPFWIGNPDLIAPLENSISIEPGSYTFQMSQSLFRLNRYFGKPFPSIFDEVKRRCNLGLTQTIDPQRMLMVGDTLHTDVLGGNAAGLKTLLVTEHGFLKGLDVDSHIQRSKVKPDFIITSI
ncbi:hypothetical protein DBZ36_15340 [Alginatibacterium sediminis]|uniref:HAD-IIA family hydrolase n=1 Tax=Alginatibacterium sediminis TaxID=2164068 RepID=A0A420E8L3_9ALTE|nr:HAD hydrolase-like protein [Alginatibacterium sediminis]RKF15750.1 hypothetical protein DBZ36_15340 [Alginatibacterium sediminis]